MSSRAPAWFEQKYITGATHVLQTDGYLLRNTTMEASKIDGNQVTWKIAGAGEASQMSQTIERRPTLNANRTVATATMVPWEANELIQHTDLEQMSENEQQIAQQTCGYAMGRRFDRIIIGAMDAAGATITDQGNGAAAISITDVLAAQNGIMAQGIIGKPEMYCVLPYQWMSQLEMFREFSSSDFVGTEYPMLQAVGARRYRGITFIPVPTPAAGGDVESYLFRTGAEMYGYMWLKPAVGFCPAMNLMSRIDYDPGLKAYFAGNTMMAAGQMILPSGARRLRFLENAALTRPNP